MLDLTNYPKHVSETWREITIERRRGSACLREEGHERERKKERGTENERVREMIQIISVDKYFVSSKYL